MLEILFCLLISKGLSLKIHYEYEETLEIQEDELTANDQRWNEFVKKYNKTYTSSDLLTRRRIFNENVRMIDRHNSLFRAGLKSYSMAVNYFADLSSNEISQTMFGFKFGSKQRNFESILGEFDMPEEVNWVKKNVVTDVKNQKNCGSCYAFSATGSLEGQYAIKNKKLKSFSEQNILDCSQKYRNHGCHGGLMDLSFEYIIENGGIDTEEEYPYEAKVGKCRYVKDPLKLSKFVDVPEGSENQLQKAVAAVGPISVAIDANHFSFQFYSSGVYYEPLCSSIYLDHGVLAVGYGEEQDSKYWLVKNSWGPDWGDKGYIKMARDRNNHCGIATAASYPVLA